MTIQTDGLHAAAQPVGDRQASAKTWGGVLAEVSTEVNVVIEVKSAQSAWSCAGGGVHLVQHQFGVITIHLQGNRVPLPVVNLSTLD